jgi:hypothetical protein
MKSCKISSDQWFGDCIRQVLFLCDKVMKDFRVTLYLSKSIRDMLIWSVAERAYIIYDSLS